MSSEVKRYDPMGYDRLSGYMQQHPEGDYVRHADYAALEAECERLADELDRKSVITGDYIARCQRLAAEQPDTVGVPRKLLAEAESIIDSYAEALKQCHAPRGDWAGEEAAQDDYEHEAGVASELRAILAIAQIQERNQ